MYLRSWFASSLFFVLSNDIHYNVILDAYIRNTYILYDNSIKE